MNNDSQAMANTDRLLWENPKQDVGYRDSVSVTENGAVVLCSGGYCCGKTVAEWVEIAWPKDQRGLQGTGVVMGQGPPDYSNLS